MVDHKTYPGEVRQLIREVIRQRNRLINAKRSSVNVMKALRIIEKLTRHNGCNFTDRGAAKYLKQHADEIRYLIDANNVNLFNRLNMLLHHGQSILSKGTQIKIF